MRREVTRRVFAEQQISALDPVSVFLLLRIIWSVLSLVFQFYDLN